MMDAGMYELIENILHGVSFIAIGGAIAIIFFFVFAPSILGSKTTHKKLESMGRQIEEMNEQLKKIAQQLSKEKESHKKGN